MKSNMDLDEMETQPRSTRSNCVYIIFGIFPFCIFFIFFIYYISPDPIFYTKASTALLSVCQFKATEDDYWSHQDNNPLAVMHRKFFVRKVEVTRPNYVQERTWFDKPWGNERKVYVGGEGAFNNCP